LQAELYTRKYRPNMQELNVAEDWEKQFHDDLRFDLLVEKEALGKLNLSEAKELEQLQQRRNKNPNG
jgi:hypothetical protein